MTKEQRWIYTLYISVCALDFLLAPIAWAILQVYYTGSDSLRMWAPMTFQYGSVFHITMMIMILAVTPKIQTAWKELTAPQATVLAAALSSPALLALIKLFSDQ